MTDTAALTNDVEATLENALETITDPAIAAAAGETFVSVEDASAAVREALAGAAVELRGRADGQGADAAEVADELRRLAERLEEPGAWQTVDRVVHELVSDLLVGAVALPRRGVSGALTARAIALAVLADRDAIWPGASPRLGTPHGYDGLIALVRTSARAT